MRSRRPAEFPLLVFLVAMSAGVPRAMAASQASASVVVARLANGIAATSHLPFDAYVLLASRGGASSSQSFQNLKIASGATVSLSTHGQDGWHVANVCPIPLDIQLSPRLLSCPHEPGETSRTAPRDLSEEAEFDVLETDEARRAMDIAATIATIQRDQDDDAYDTERLIQATFAYATGEIQARTPRRNDLPSSGHPTFDATADFVWWLVQPGAAAIEEGEQLAAQAAERLAPLAVRAPMMIDSLASILHAQEAMARAQGEFAESAALEMGGHRLDGRVAGIAIRRACGGPAATHDRLVLTAAGGPLPSAFALTARTDAGGSLTVLFRAISGRNAWIADVWWPTSATTMDFGRALPGCQIDGHVSVGRQSFSSGIRAFQERLRAVGRAYKRARLERGGGNHIEAISSP